MLSHITITSFKLFLADMTILAFIGWCTYQVIEYMQNAYGSTKQKELGQADLYNILRKDDE